MTAFLFSFFSFLISPSFALYEISCWEGSCLKNGWTQENKINGKFTDFQCYREGCENSGWIVGGLEGLNYYTQCKSGGCFQSGWYELDRRNHQLQKEVVCEASGCLQGGWKEYSNSGTVLVECRSGDCEKQGWLVLDFTHGFYEVICKTGGCMSEGWISTH